MADNPSGVTEELSERYPLLTSLSIGEDPRAEATIPPLMGVLMSSVDTRAIGASCLVLPTRSRVPFALAVLVALRRIRQTFDTLELDRLTTPLTAGQLVRVAPIGKVFEFVGEVRTGYGHYLQLRNRRDDQIHHLPAEEAFRLAPTMSDSPSAFKGERPGRWEPAPIDQLLDIRTGGNVAVIPNGVILVSSRSEIQQLADSTRLRRSQEDGRGYPVSDVLTWGRIQKDGKLVSEDRRDGAWEPIIAVTHSVEFMAEACRASGAGTKVVIMDGAASLSRNLHAYDISAEAQRLMIIGDEGQLDNAQMLAERGCQVWVPDRQVLLNLQGRQRKGWFAPVFHRIRNAAALSVVAEIAEDDAAAAIASHLRSAEATSHTSEEAKKLITGGYHLLLRISEWFGDPGSAALESISGKVRELERLLERNAMFLDREFRESFTPALNLFRKISTGSVVVGSGKLESLASALQRPGSPDSLIVVRSATAAAQLRNRLQERNIQASVRHISSDIEDDCERIILGSWPGRRAAARLISRNLAPQVLLIGYEFEAEWMESYRAWREREHARFQRSAAEARTFSGLRSWIEPSEPPQRQGLPPQPVDREPAEDPISRFLGTRRKGEDVRSHPDTDLREAWYVGFHGSGYAFLAETHKVPVLTDLVLGDGASGTRVPLRPVRKLQVGDFVLFRDHGDRDVIALIAEQQMGSAVYDRLREIAGRWREALRSLGSEPRAVQQLLRDLELDRNLLTIRIWLTDDEMIGPGSRRDLEIIARASGDEYLRSNLDEVEAAMRAIRGAHVQAGATLSRLLLAELPARVSEVDESGTKIDFTFGSGYVVCVEEISDHAEERPYWEVNQLLFDEEP